MTIPEIQAYRKELGKNISLKMGMPDILSGNISNSPTAKEEPSQDDVDTFFGGF